MNLRAVGWGVAFLAAGAAVAAGWIGSSWSTGPRAGAASLLLVFGLVFVLGSFAAAIRRRTERIDGAGGCPVGATCGCGHFNFKPRRRCKHCGSVTLFTA